VKNKSLAVTVLVGFFAFGTTMCCLTIVLLTFPGTALDAAWRINPDAAIAFQQMGWAAIPLMAAVGTACAAAAIGLARRRKWGRRVAIAVLAVNLIGDVAGAIIRHDPRTLIGVPIGGAMILFLLRQKIGIRNPS
jgi:hypothetical protein